MAVRREPNERLAAVIAESGCTYEALAKQVRTVAAEAGEALRTSRSAVFFWVNGGTPTGKTATYLAEALSRMTKRKVTVTEIRLGCDGIGEAMSADPLAAAADLGRFAMQHRRDFLTAAFAAAAVGLPLTYDHQAAAATLRAADSGGRIGMEEVSCIRRFTEMFRSADDRLGGGYGLTAVTVYFTDTVVQLLSGRFPSEQVRRDAYGAAATLACLVGWKHHDLGREGAAQRFYLLGYQLACESDPAGHGAWMMRALTHQALDVGQPAHCVESAEAALSRARKKVDRNTEALLLVTAARAYGACGEGTKAAAALVSAEDAMLVTDDAVPSYAAASGPVAATIASHTAKTLTELRDHKAAEQHYRLALKDRTPETYQRVHGLTMANLAKSVAAQRRHDEALGLWHRSLDFMGGVASDRNRKEITTMRSVLVGYRKRGIAGAAELDQRAADVLRAMA
ncbi:hypothetical protein ABH930_002946 [Kitasatospora sp. GAS204A]|uniref:tetratricopeptide repeat protein n=1 Tax=unclassified Kitasatospora TaxID=2633591 RepID=UPI00247687B6|nr:tetratricopeptide repeat protein [Kitasatospora sp. GAS204B]MDH6121775.1 hypothetical protein [Kitasatospora sp. GAS204B]